MINVLILHQEVLTSQGKCVPLWSIFFRQKQREVQRHCLSVPRAKTDQHEEVYYFTLQYSDLSFHPSQCGLFLRHNCFCIFKCVLMTGKNKNIQQFGKTQ